MIMPCHWMFKIKIWRLLIQTLLRNLNNLKINLVLAIMIGSLVIQLPMSNENHKQTKMLTTFKIVFLTQMSH